MLLRFTTHSISKDSKGSNSSADTLLRVARVWQAFARVDSGPVKP